AMNLLLSRAQEGQSSRSLAPGNDNHLRVLRFSVFLVSAGTLQAQLLSLILLELWCHIGPASETAQAISLLRRFLYGWKGKSEPMGVTAKTAVLLGASGLVGGYCLQTLLADPGYARILLLVRRELVAVRHPRLTQKTVDFDSLTQSDFTGANDVFCALGTT